MMEELLRAMLHSFSLSKVSHKDEFYLERFLMRQHFTNSHLTYLLWCLLFCWIWSFGVCSVLDLEVRICDQFVAECWMRMRRILEFT